MITGFFFVYNLRMRLYSTSKWQKIRARQLYKSPLCAYCYAQGLIVAANIVDHITPHKNNIDLFFDSQNLQSLCKHCHDSHKQRYEKSGRVIGCNTEGMPINAKSHWYE